MFQQITSAFECLDSCFIIVVDFIVAIQELIVVPRNLSFHVVHAFIANFKCMCVAHFLEGMGVWKGLHNNTYNSIKISYLLI